MKSGGPWNLRGLRPETRAAAREAARQSGMSVGEWLNTVIQPDDEDYHDDPSRPADFDREAEQQWRRSFRHEGRGRRRDGEGHWRRRDREPDEFWQPSSRYEEQDYERPRAPWRRRAREPDDQFRLNFRNENRERGRYSDEHQRQSDHFEADMPVRPEGGPYHEERPHRDGVYDRYRAQRHEQSHERGEQEQRYLSELDEQHRQRHQQGQHRERPRPRREPERFDGPPVSRAPQNDRDALVDRAVAEIIARQQSLDEVATAEIKARQRALDGEGAEALSFGDRQPAPLPETDRSGSNQSPHSASAPPAFDLSGLERQLQQITSRVEALQPAKGLETAINGLRADLAEIGRSLTEALPRRAVESLEIEIKALAERIDHTRQSGVDSIALAGLESGLAEVRDGLRKLTPAESLVGFEEAVKALAKKVDGIVAKQDPAALEQLETAISALRSIVSHVASNDTLTKVAEDVRSLAGKVDGLANSELTLSALSNRIDTLASALKASTEAGHAVPRELEKLLSGLIEKLEWVQLTHTEHTALAHLEDRIAMLVKRLDSSDSRLGLLEGVERGLADLLAHIDQLRGTSPEGKAAAPEPTMVQVIEQEVAEIRQSERRTQDSLEAVQDTVEHVVDRLATIESDIRIEKAKAIADEPLPMPAEEPPLVTPVPSDEPVTMPEPSEAAEAKPPPPEPPRRALATRAPIDPNLPPDHPLEPGFIVGRPRHGPSAADRIAASEAAVGMKPPVIPDPGGGKPDFIAAARRAAQAAALAAPHDEASAQPKAGSVPRSKKLTDRLRSFMVAAAVFVIVLGSFHILSRLFQESSSGTPPTAETEAARARSEPQVQVEPPPAQPEPQAQTERSPPPAAMPGANPASVNPSNLPLSILGPSSGADLAPDSGAAPPSASVPGPATGVAPGRQSTLDVKGWPTAASGHAAPEKSIGSGTPNALMPWATPEITGSLPQPLSLRAPATAPSLTGGDKLPTAIGVQALRTAALAGDPTAAYEIAVRFTDGRGVAPNNDEAARWFERAAKKGLAPAQFRLGSLYEKGIGVRKDLAAARDLYRAAAEKGHGKAMHNLAVLYAEGINGSAADYHTAAQWFRKAADRGITDSQYNLAILYARGTGVEQNFAESYKWFYLAAKEGDKDAAQKRDEVATHLNEHALAAARLAAEQWTPLPQPADAITVTTPEAWNTPAKGASLGKPKSASKANMSVPDATKID
jgi:localization factor PodJL